MSDRTKYITIYPHPMLGLQIDTYYCSHQKLVLNPTNHENVRQFPDRFSVDLHLKQLHHPDYISEIRHNCFENFDPALLEVMEMKE
ncbi:MAG: hypothetical protein QNJ51_05020 [Calothrix sp. MO_167.B12]|nr:hypothetical protein [Calothrix sp. MO_167.B12]